MNNRKQQKHWRQTSQQYRKGFSGGFFDQRPIYIPASRWSKNFRGVWSANKQNININVILILRQYINHLTAPTLPSPLSERGGGKVRKREYIKRLWEWGWELSTHALFNKTDLPQSRFSSHPSLLRKLDEVRDSGKFRYKLDFDWFKNNGNKRNWTTSVLIESRVCRLGMRNSTGLACPAGKLNGRFKWHLFILLLTRQKVSRLTATYLGWRSPHGLPQKRFPKFFECAPLVEDSPTAVQMPTTGQPDNRRMWLWKWIGVEILITGCHAFTFNLVVRICGISRNISNLVVYHKWHEWTTFLIFLLISNGSLLEHELTQQTRAHKSDRTVLSAFFCIGWKIKWVHMFIPNLRFVVHEISSQEKVYIFPH